MSEAIRSPRELESAMRKLRHRVWWDRFQSCELQEMWADDPVDEYVLEISDAAHCARPLLDVLDRATRCEALEALVARQRAMLERASEAIEHIAHCRECGDVSVEACHEGQRAYAITGEIAALLAEGRTETGAEWGADGAEGRYVDSTAS